MSVASIPHLLSSELVHHITTNQENLNLQSLFGSSKYSAGITKRVVIASGVTIGATNTSNYALDIPSGFGGKIILVNQGSILAAGGAANSGTGGSALNAGASNIFIDNRGTISGGGGGGGVGGNGGGGYYTESGSSYWADTVCSGNSMPCYTLNPPFPCNCGDNCRAIRKCGDGINYTLWEKQCTYCYTNTFYTSGGTGGAGGRGQGYDAAASSGTSGTAGGTNAGAGGTGGTGGSYGNNGDTGNSGANGNNGTGSAGTAGGLAGFYIVNNSNVTWIANGTRNGRVG